MKRTAKLYRFTDSPDEPPLYAAEVDDSGEYALIGERWQVEALAARLSAFLTTGADDGEIDHLAEELGNVWITIAEAVDLARDTGHPISAPVIRAACADGSIASAEHGGRAWRFPQRRFLGWLMAADKHRRGRRAAGSGR